MRINAALGLAVWLALAAPRARAADAQTGTSGAQFLKLGAGARAGAMADAFSALADDASAAYYNPAGLSRLPRPQIAGAHTAYFEGISYDVLQFAYPFGGESGNSRHGLALGIYYLSVGDIERRVSDTTDSIGQFNASDASYAASYSYGFGPRLSVGGTGKYISQNLDSYRAGAFALDAGVLYRVNPDAERPVSVSGVLKNLGTRPSFAGVGDPLPVSGTVGLGFQPLQRLKLDLEAARYRDTAVFGALGGEFSHPFNESLSGALRCGYSSRRRDGEGLDGLTLGGGLNWGQASFDLAWVPMGRLGNTFRYSLLVKF